MEKNPPKARRNKPYFCYDENLQFVALKKKCSKFALFESFVKLMKKQGAKDKHAITECNRQDKHIITHNTKDFRDPHSSIRIGIICVGLGNDDDWIPKFNKLFKVLQKHEQYYFKTILLNNSITIKDRKSGEIRIID